MIRFLLIIFLQIPASLQSQTSASYFDIRGIGMGNIFSIQEHAGSAFSNPGGLSTDTKYSILSGYGIAPQLVGLNRAGFAFITSIRNVFASLSAYKFGDELYGETQLGIGFSHKMGLARLGVKFNYHQINIETLGSTSGVSIDFGVVVELTPQLFIGATIFNLNQAKWSGQDRELIPVTYRSGISYKPVKQLIIASEVEKNTDNAMVFKSGINYIIKTKFILRTGINTNPVFGTYGCGFNSGKLNIDYAIQSKRLFGPEHFLSLFYSFGSRL